MKKLFMQFILLVVIYSCNQEYTIDTSLTGLPISTDILSSENLSEYYDLQIAQFAQSIAQAVKSEDVRKIIKQKAMQKLDGDYDVIWKDFKHDYAILKDERKSMLDILVDSQSKKPKESAKADFESFNDLFKRLQIAVPVNCEKWETSSFVPDVVFLTSGYSEEQEFVLAFNAKGELIQLSNKVRPDYPVIVISQNERSDDNGEILSMYPALKSIKKPFIPITMDVVTPESVSGTASSAGIHITWTYNGSASDSIKIERNSGTGYQQIASIVAFNSDYLDNNVNYGDTYFYRLKAVSPSGEESPYSSAISVTHIPIPSAPNNFNANNYWPGQMTLTWSNTIAYQQSVKVRIDRWVHGVSTSWASVAELPVTQNSYIDANLQSTIYPANRCQYRVYYYKDANNQSDAAFAVEYNSARSPGQPLKITHIKVPDLDQIESWVYGAPEFDISIASMNTAATAPVWLKQKFRYEPPQRIGDSNVVYNDNTEILGNWDKNFAQSVMAVNIVEYDGELISGKLTVKVNAKKTLKLPAIGEISTETGGELELNFRTGDKDLGTEYIYYWENESVLRTYSYGVRVRFSNTSLTQAWNNSWN